jgi:pyruvate,water dikinase
MDEFKQAQARMRIFYDRVATQLCADSQQAWNRNEVVSLTHGEILDYLQEGKIPDFEEAVLRTSQQYIYYTVNGQPQFIYGEKDIEDAMTEITGRDLINRNIKGTVAFRGFAKGKVSIVNSKADLSKVQLGDILVARVTMPDYLPAMVHAAAFVTDEGGITSHAAIVARELKKPCVVGTKIATNMLKDGDIVEVDATTGIIKKI